MIGHTCPVCGELLDQQAVSDDRPAPVDRIKLVVSPPPTPKMLREAANILETAPYQRGTEAAWLREVAAATEPEPDPAQVEALESLLAEAARPGGSWRKQAERLARRGVRAPEATP